MPAMPTPDARPADAPAYASAPRRSGLLYAIAAIVALAAIAAMAIFLFGGRASAPSTPPGDLRGADARKALESAKAALDEASRSVLMPAPSSTSPSDPTPSQATPAVPSQATTVPSPVAPQARPAPVEPPRVAASTPARAPRPAVTAPEAPAPPPPVVAPAAPAPAQVATAERFGMMRDEIARCSTASVIPRIQCERRIRARYCDGYWGSVPDCPTGPAGRS
ncbi:MAG: hypothetical protein ABI585_00325 [Betaproteobacteria bacterium]